MTVIDASALTSYLLREPNYERVGSYLQIGAVSIELVFKETANAILTAYRLGRIDRSSLLAELKALSKMMPIIETDSQEKIIDKAAELALNTGLTIYDSLYIVLAKERGLPLLTGDKQQAKIAERKGVKVIEL